VRNTPSLYNVAQQNWFFWDGRKDSLWAQALAPLENPAEHAFSRLQVVHFIASDKHYRKQYQAIFPEALPGSEALASLPGKGGPEASIDALIAWKKLPQKLKHDVNRLFSNIGKSIAAYVATIKSKPSQFDRFAAEIQKKAKSDILDKSAQRGLKLFLGRANCANCHSGALFSNKEFHNIGTGIPGKDNGRAEVINQVRHDIFNCLGEYSDAKPAQCMELTYMGSNSHALSGAYRTPSLRNVAKTAPYMHDGRFKTLDDVLAYYASIDNKKALETDLPPMKLSKQDQQDIIRFLQSL
jgi:cytochrome c peroxidase